MSSGKSFRIKLPATSANLGPGFDALGLAMGLYLTIEATCGSQDTFVIDAVGRDAGQCSVVENNLILTTYVDVLANVGKLAERLHLKVNNEIPLGMGMGSSAAALLAGVYLANHFGELGWTPQQILEEACRREGHPDNIAACFHGGMTASAEFEGKVLTATYQGFPDWKLLIALPSASLSTKKARAMLPERYSKADTVANIQATALLVSAFAQGRGELLRAAMQDRIHQPYRMKAAPLLEKLLPIEKQAGVLGVALSGAGPSVLVIVEASAVQEVPSVIREAAGEATLEVLETSIAGGVEL